MGICVSRIIILNIFNKDPLTFTLYLITILKGSKIWYLRNTGEVLVILIIEIPTKYWMITITNALNPVAQTHQGP